MLLGGLGGAVVAVECTWAAEGLVALLTDEGLVAGLHVEVEGEVAALDEVLAAVQHRAVEAVHVLAVLVDEELLHAAL